MLNKDSIILKELEKLDKEIMCGTYKAISEQIIKDQNKKIEDLQLGINELESILILERRKIALLCKLILTADFDNQLRSDFIDMDFLEGISK